MDSPQVSTYAKAFVFHLSENKIAKFYIDSRTSEEISGTNDDFFYKAAILVTGDVYIDGAYRVGQEICHTGILLRNKQFSEYSKSSLGRVALSLISNDSHLYFISPDACERLNIVNSKLEPLPAMPYQKQYPAACVFDKSIVVIGGLGSNHVLSFNLETL